MNVIALYGFTLDIPVRNHRWKDTCLMSVSQPRIRHVLTKYKPIKRILYGYIMWLYLSYKSLIAVMLDYF